MPRTKMIRVVVSIEEEKKAKALADAQGLTLSAYLRSVIVTTPMPSQKHRAV